MGLLVRKGANMHHHARLPANGKLPEGWFPPKKNGHLSSIIKFQLPDKFAWDDLAQQIVGAMILSAPLAVTEEVWHLSAALDWGRIIVMVLITIVFNILLLYYAKYQLLEQEKILGVVPTRLFSQVLVSYTTAALMLYLMGVLGGVVTGAGESLRLIAFVGLFANIGAGAADLLK